MSESDDTWKEIRSSSTINYVHDLSFAAVPQLD
jgi:hypothetical protein